jgi:hypothetical protein
MRFVTASGYCWCGIQLRDRGVDEEDRVAGILAELGLLNDKDVILIDARADNKPSGSKA